MPRGGQHRGGREGMEGREIGLGDDISIPHCSSSIARPACASLMFMM